MVEPNRQLERKGLGRTIHPFKTDKDTWLVQKREYETPKDILQRILDQRNASKRRSQKEAPQKKPRNEENNLELQVVSPVEHNSNYLLPEIDEMAVLLPQEREDNPSIQNEKEVESSQPCDTIPSPISRGEEEKTVFARLQPNKSSPIWLGDFVTGGELDQSLSNSTATRTLSVATAEMAQKQLECLPAL